MYAICPRIFDYNWKKPATLRDYAKRIFKSIKKIRANGPYYFLGECIGGSLVVGLQQVAEGSGDGPGMVILINSHYLFNKEYIPVKEGRLEIIKNYLYQLRDFCFTLTSSIVKIKKIINALRRVLLGTNMDMIRLNEYYELLYLVENITLASELHLLLSEDEKDANSIFNAWRELFKQDAFLYRIEGNHSWYHKSPQAIMVTLNQVLVQKAKQ